MWRLEIEKLGPLEQLVLDESKLVLLIGPQASGKSTLAKAMYFFLSFPHELVSFCFKQQFNEHPIENLWVEQARRFLQFWDTASLAEAHIRFTFKDEIGIEVQGDANGLVKFHRSESFDRQFLEIFNGWRDTSPEIQLLSLNQTIQSFLGIDYPIYYIPAGRSILSQFSGQIMPIAGLDYTMEPFANLVNNFARHIPAIIQMALADPGQSTKQVSLALAVGQKLLKGEFRFEKEGRLFFGKGDSLPLSRISSGQQEALWIVYLLSYWLITRTNVFLVVEEPEAHLYPEGQRDMAFLLSLFVTNGGRGIITTHSPYLLGAFNNHMYAHQLGQKVGDAVAAVIPKEAWLDPQGVQGFFLDQGRAHSIIDSELGLLKSEAVDSASGLIGQEYESLLDLDFVP